VQAWLFILDSSCFPLWWIASVLRTPSTRWSWLGYGEAVTLDERQTLRLCVAGERAGRFHGARRPALTELYLRDHPA